MTLINNRQDILGQNYSQIFQKIDRILAAARMSHQKTKIRKKKDKGHALRITSGIFSNWLSENHLKRRILRVLNQRLWLLKNSLTDIVTIIKWWQTGLKQKKSEDYWEETNERENLK